MMTGRMLYSERTWREISVLQGFTGDVGWRDWADVGDSRWLVG